MRVRISYQKRLQIRYTSTLDLQSIWERSMRRASIKVEYSKGFHPQPRIQLGVPLPLGCIGLDEKVDIWLKGSLSIEEISRKLQGKLPEGLEINTIEEIMPTEKPLSSIIQFSEYEVYLLNEETPIKDIQNRITKVLNQKEIIRTKRNGKKYDLKPLILSITLKDDNEERPSILIKLLSQSNRTGRADEVMFALGFSITDFLVERIGSFT
ncbi:MAG: TIGR03936 family radical SAM-associated protein [Pelolinea sp.]|nr:TIGR03936 family radical SAM-associated protein [Pelolinea sp.]